MFAGKATAVEILENSLYSGYKAAFPAVSNFHNITIFPRLLQTRNCGVPQDSILGALYLIFHINELPNVPNVTETIFSR